MHFNNKAMFEFEFEKVKVAAALMHKESKEKEGATEAYTHSSGFCSLSAAAGWLALMKF